MGLMSTSQHVIELLHPSGAARQDAKRLNAYSSTVGMDWQTRIVDIPGQKRPTIDIPGQKWANAKGCRQWLAAP